MFEVDSLSVAYGEITALRDVSLDVTEGEIVALIGANGAGKTTLLRTVSGLLSPNEGTITYRDQDIVTLDPDEIARAGVIHVPEGRQIFPDLTVRENLDLGTFASRGRGTDPDASREEVYDIFPRLEERREQRGSSLSGGEQQMLAIGRALMSDPDLLLLDEPSLGLAPQIVEDVKQIISRLNDQGITVLLVEQNANMALDLSNRAYILQNGGVRMQGDSQDLRQRDEVRESYLGM